MSEQIEDLRAKFLKAYAQLPSDERTEIIVIIEDKPHTWDRAYDEVNNSTELGEKILKQLHIIGLL